MEITKGEDSKALANGMKSDRITSYILEKL